MKHFNINDFVNYIKDDEGNKLEFGRLAFYRFDSNDEHQYITMHDSSNGYIPSKNEINTIIIGLTRFLNEFNQDEIDEFNQEVKLEREKQMQEELKEISLIEKKS